MPDTETKSSLIAAAGQIFVKYGYRKASLDDIASLLNKGKTFIYYYFRSKEEIFQAVIESEVRQILASLEAAAAGGQNPEEKLRNYILAWTKSLKEASNYNLIILNGHCCGTAFQKAVREKTDKKQLEILSSILDEGIKANCFRGDIDPEWLAQVFFTAIKGFEIPLLTRTGFSNMEKRIDDLLDIVLNGLRNNRL